ncbi:hypothetical protein SAM40697_6155 [Streptomyces ambofaciens]|uniref:Fumarylacetoacetase-like C-terminal domain-containing protein n=1 Tax=Streptomyces ambofaciens TaxID=1889 RepID=A0ABM6B8C9_STRAM|nr:hypothetical protein SAM40697_6155 [Streptomyces ambofaciens]
MVAHVRDTWGRVPEHPPEGLAGELAVPLSAGGAAGGIGRITSGLAVDAGQGRGLRKHPYGEDVDRPWAARATLVGRTLRPGDSLCGGTTSARPV